MQRRVVLNHSFVRAAMVLPLGLGLAAPVRGQLRVGPERVAAARQIFDASATAPKLRCELRALPPSLDFAFVFETGFTTEIPLSQFPPGKHDLSISIRATAQGQEPVYLTMSETIPRAPTASRIPTTVPSNGEISSAGFAVEMDGQFAVGEGAYRVEVLIQDERQRACRGAWQIQTRRTGSERLLNLSMPPGAVEEVRDRNHRELIIKPGPAIDRLTILMHAAPLRPNRAQLQPPDVQRLLDSVRSLMAQLPSRSVRLLAFNLDQQAVVFRANRFAPSQMTDLAASLQKLELAKVDYQVLRDSRKAGDLLLGLMDAELREPKPPDALIVMGSRPRTPSGEASAEVLAKLSGAAFPIFYLRYQVNRTVRGLRGASPDENVRLGRGAARGRAAPAATIPEMAMPGWAPDAIEGLVKRLKGQTISIRTPHDLADAIQRLDGRIVRTGGSGGGAASEK